MATLATLKTLTPLVPAGPDLAEGLKFYVEQMGFTCLWQGGGHAAIRRDHVGLLLVESGDRHWADNSSHSIGVSGLDRLYDEFKTVTTRVGPLEVKPWGRREFHIILPSGVCFQFFELDGS